LKDRNDKIEEMKNYFTNKSSKTLSLPKFPHNMFNNAKPENVMPYHFWSDFTSASIPFVSVPSVSMPSISSRSQINEVQPKKVVGYVEYICSHCLEFEPLRVMYDPSASDNISWTRHACDPDILNSTMAYPMHFREDILMYRILRLSEEMIKAVKEWTNGEVFLISDKINSREVPKNSITLDLRKNEYNWLTRAIVQKYTILNDKELREFFNLIFDSCATFCCLCINFVEKEGEQDVKREYYCFCLSYKPRFPWEYLMSYEASESQKIINEGCHDRRMRYFKKLLKIHMSLP
jgi:hypothetical protein